MYSLSYKVSKPVEENMSFGKYNVIPTYSSTSTNCVSPKNKDGTKKVFYTPVWVVYRSGLG